MFQNPNKNVDDKHEHQILNYRTSEDSIFVFNIGGDTSAGGLLVSNVSSTSKQNQPQKTAKNGLRIKVIIKLRVV